MVDGQGDGGGNRTGWQGRAPGRESWRCRRERSGDSQEAGTSRRPLRPWPASATLPGSTTTRSPPHGATTRRGTPRCADRTARAPADKRGPSCVEPGFGVKPSGSAGTVRCHQCSPAAARGRCRGGRSDPGSIGRRCRLVGVMARVGCWVGGAACWVPVTAALRAEVLSLPSWRLLGAGRAPGWCGAGRAIVVHAPSGVEECRADGDGARLVRSTSGSRARGRLPCAARALCVRANRDTDGSPRSRETATPRPLLETDTSRGDGRPAQEVVAW